MAYTLTEQHLHRLCEINNFNLPTGQMILFGLRGCLPVDTTDHDFATEHEVDFKELNYVNPRCTIIQWRPADGEFAVFPGSTVPSLKHVRTGATHGGSGVNQLATGYYDDYRKGYHKAGKPTGHEAFRQNEAHPIRRSADDYDYDNDDHVEIGNPYDNIHAAWCQGVDSQSNYESAGCQVIVGFPKCPRRAPNPNIGPWKTFHDNAYQIAQTAFPYVLLNGRDALQAITADAGTVSVRVRFGSTGPLVGQVQTALKATEFYEGIVDEDFGGRTLRAVLGYQTAVFGPDQDDGIVGKLTAGSLGIANWPKV